MAVHVWEQRDRNQLSCAICKKRLPTLGAWVAAGKLVPDFKLLLEEDCKQRTNPVLLGQED